MSDLNLEHARVVADHYTKACEITCRVIDASGTTLFIATPDGASPTICDLADASDSSVCGNAHLFGSYQSERFGGQYVYFCPMGMTHYASPIMIQGQIAGALIGGPVHLVDPDDLLFDELAEKLAVLPENQAQFDAQIRAVPVVRTERVNSLSELLYMAACSLSDPTFDRLEQTRKSNDLQAELWDQINFLKSFAYVDQEHLSYPFEKEELLLEQIANGEKAAAQQILNEILGHIFFSSSGSIEAMRARVIELVVLLSRAAIRGGADVEQIFGLNYTYLGKIYSFRNIDEIAFWLAGIMARFTDQVFNLSQVKHADVIFRVCEHVKKYYMKKLTLDETAALVYLSPAYFSRVFKDEMGLNFNMYVNQYRVEAAKRLLLNEAVSLTAISAMVG
ncbi:MAG: PocR ligand-binding domain-containing protein, partial [Eubacteriales bacterium]|nr:PocR ligand-binding domain-containing protein [Eubacteriales bacterium]